jgi:hypothetical protein
MLDYITSLSVTCGSIIWFYREGIHIVIYLQVVLFEKAREENAVPNL